MRTIWVLPVLCAFGCAAGGSVGEDGVALQPNASRVRAELDFKVGWTQVQRGAIVRGGHVDVVYERSRLPAGCADATVFANAQFRPGGERFSSDEAFGFDVPAAAQSVDLWFHALSPTCDYWDSNYGRNWRFPVVATAPAAVGWAGDWGSSTNRACAHAPGVPQPITIDEYMRERACIFVDADVWIPGVTDVSAPHPEWILAEVEWAKDAQAPSDAWLEYQGIVGHNARFRWSVPYEVRNLADWSTVRYAFRFSSDGSTWTRVAQASGADWTLVRAFSLPTP
jgi:hypothetical protein